MKNKKVFAHLLTWFQSIEYSNKWEMWNSDYEGSLHNPDIILENGKRDIASLTYPLIGAYDSNDPDVIEYQLLTMRLAGIDGVIIDWDGREINRYRHEGLLNILPFIKKFNMKLMICFEEWCGYWPISHNERKHHIKKALQELKWLHENILNTDIYHKINDNSPVLVFRKIPSHWFTSKEWSYMKKQTKELKIDFLFNDIYDESFHEVSDGYFTWVSGFDQDTNLNDLNRYQNQIENYMIQVKKQPKETLFIGSVLPGFNDEPVNGWGDGTRIAPRYDMKRYQKSWDYMKEYDIDLVQIVTWNDWNEGSQIEPCETYGYQYINESKKQINLYKGIEENINYDSLQFPLDLFKLRKSNNNKRDLDEIAELLKNNDTTKAKELLSKMKEKEE